MTRADRHGKIVVTRSEPGATALVAALRRAGFASLSVQLLEIVALDASRAQAVLERLDRFDTAIVVSGHAVRFGIPLIDTLWPRRPELHWIAVGAATARALAEHGVEASAPERESSEGILALPQLREVAGRRVLLLAGRRGRSLLADELTRRGASVELLELYERRPAPVEAAAKRLAATTVAAVEVGSVTAARVFAAVWAALGRDRSVALLAPSVRVAAALGELGFTHAVDCGGAGAEAMVATLTKLMGGADE